MKYLLYTIVFLALSLSSYCSYYGISGMIESQEKSIEVVDYELEKDIKLRMIDEEPIELLSTKSPYSIPI